MKCSYYVVTKAASVCFTRRLYQYFLSMDKVILSTDKVILPMDKVILSMDKVILSMDKIWQIKTLSMDGIFILQILDKLLCIMFSNESLPLVGISYKTFAYKDKNSIHG